MSFFSHSKAPVANEYRPLFGYWDQRMYDAFFGYSPSEMERVIGRYFHFTLFNRETTLQHGLPLNETYCGHQEWTLTKSKPEVCKIALQLEVKGPDYGWTRHIKELRLGWMSFEYCSVDGVQRPSFFVAIRDQAQGGKTFSAHLSQLFAEVKAAGGKGVEVTWSAILTPMLGASAAHVWGDWDKDSPRDGDGVLVPGKFPGRHAFQLESIEFKAVL
jgi:hypothetical protein